MVRESTEKRELADLLMRFFIRCAIACAWRIQVEFESEVYEQNLITRRRRHREIWPRTGCRAPINKIWLEGWREGISYQEAMNRRPSPPPSH